MNDNDNGDDEIQQWIARNRRRRADFADGPEGDQSFSQWQAKYAHALQQIMNLPAVQAAGRRFASHNSHTVMDEDGRVIHSDRGVHRDD